MITKQEILKAVKHITRHSQGKQESKLIHPTRDWGIGLIVMVLLVAVGAWYNYALYNRYNDIDSLVESTPEKIPSYREEIVNDVVETYNERKTAFDQELQLISAAAQPVESLATSTTTASIGSSTESMTEQVEIIEVLETDMQ